MYFDFSVSIPSASGISIKTIRGVSYVYFSRNVYSAEKKRTIPVGTSIGKVLLEDSTRMFPNQKFYSFFPEEENNIPEIKESVTRSKCLRVGSYIVIRNLIQKLHLEKIAQQIFQDKAGLFLDFMAYSIVTENNAGQYYPDYAFNHPLFTKDMRLYSDATLSNFFKECAKDKTVEFLNLWNEHMDHLQQIYVSYDSTNKACQAGDLEMVEYGHSKVDNGKPIINYAIAYDCKNRTPLAFEEYPGSLTDVVQLKAMIEKMESYGYKRLGFILDRGYFSAENIRYMDKHNNPFVLMLKGKKDLVKKIIEEVKGTFEDNRSSAIRKYGVNGTTVKRTLYASDDKERYFHIYYSDERKASERALLETHIDRCSDILNKKLYTPYHLDKDYQKYFDAYYTKREDDEEEILTTVFEKTDVIDEEIRQCGYFVIVTSEEMTAAEALRLYKGRDASEKLFRADKTFLGNNSFRVTNDNAISAKMLTLFNALIVRNKMYGELIDSVEEGKTIPNYKTVPASIKELEKIEIIKGNDGEYHLAYALTATQKDILKAFGISENELRTEIAQINKALHTTIKSHL